MFLTLTNVGMIIRPALFRTIPSPSIGTPPTPSSVYDGCVPERFGRQSHRRQLTRTTTLARTPGTSSGPAHIRGRRRSNLQMVMVGQLYVRRAIIGCRHNDPICRAPKLTSVLRTSLPAAWWMDCLPPKNPAVTWCRNILLALIHIPAITNPVRWECGQYTL